MRAKCSHIEYLICTFTVIYAETIAAELLVLCVCMAALLRKVSEVMYHAIFAPRDHTVELLFFRQADPNMPFVLLAYRVYKCVYEKQDL